MKKSDMISLNGTDLEFCNLGLFDSETDWIHPTVTVDTTEWIYVTDGAVSIREGETGYLLRAGNLLQLSPCVEHGGTAVSHGHTSFFWLHFRSGGVPLTPTEKVLTPDRARTERFFKELMHLQNANRVAAELCFARFLVEFGDRREPQNRVAHEIAEFIRINSARALTVDDVACRFGYSPDHLSRLLKREFGTDTKSLIVQKRLETLESLLVNTDLPLCEIAARSGFEDENRFLKFFKYHEHATPTEFRNRFFYVHMNSK